MANTAEEVDQTKATPPSCLSDASVVLAATLRYMPDSTAATTMKEEPLLQVWANLVADWNAWEDRKVKLSCFQEEAVALEQVTSGNVPLVNPLSLLITVCFNILPEHVVKILSDEEDGSSNVREDGASQGLLTWAEALAGLAESASDPGLSLKSEMKLAVHNCLHLLLEATVDLKVDSSETDESHSESGSDDNEDDEDGDSDSKDGSESANSNDEHGETEEEFLERYAKTACELQEEAIKETENGQDEDGHKIELGM
ncbi:unnamed protein product [Sphagnum balticum]